ncbi:hypothetical protein D3C84_1176630 [compost metagenome]
MLPVKERLAGVLGHHFDAVLHRASDLAQVAAHTVGVDHFVAVAAIGLLEVGDGLV